MASLEQDFQSAQTGGGTRLLTHEQATTLLDHCERQGFTFQTMETFECVDGYERPRVDLSILGLTNAERVATSLSDFRQIARDRLAQAQAEPNPFLFQVWIDLPDTIVANRAARSKR
jgi:hypothetical protein